MKKKLTLENLFKILANQKRLEILMAVFDNYQTTTEVSKVVGLDISTTYRYLKSLKDAGILNSRTVKGTEMFDFSSEEIYKILQYAINFINKLNGEGRFCENIAMCEIKATPQVQLSQEPDYVLDMRGEMCPVPDLTTQQVVAEMEDGKILLVIVDYPLSAERIPNRIKQLGHELIAKNTDGHGNFYIYIKVRKQA
ncbi:MAG: sulfurtransferase TusA family protein [Fervidobacterium sp.]|uniref:sulfurtransferase TusA family protein n=1 Tax=Fervidobacterium sp. TaxID=1871331 RepID=UPI004048FB2F